MQILCKSSDVIITGNAHLDKLEGGVLYLLVRVIQMEVEEVKDLRLVHLSTPADLVVLQLVSVKKDSTELYRTDGGRFESLFKTWLFNCFKIIGNLNSLVLLVRTLGMRYYCLYAGPGLPWPDIPPM